MKAAPGLLLRAMAWLLVGLALGVLSSAYPVAAQGSRDWEYRQKEAEAADKLAGELIKGMRKNSKVMVRPFARPYTGLPQDVAVRLEGLIVESLKSKIPEDMKPVKWVTSEDVKRIYSSLNESHIGEDSDKLLKSVLIAARADAVVQCSTMESSVESFGVRCSVSSGKRVCSHDRRGDETCKSEEIRNVEHRGAGEAAFPWRSKEKYLEHVFSHVAWKLVKALPDRPTFSKVKGNTERKGGLGAFISSSLRQALNRAIRERRGLRPVGDDLAEDHEVRWEIMSWGKQKYRLTVDFYLRDDHKVGEAVYIALASLPDHLRLAKPDPDGTAGPGTKGGGKRVDKVGAGGRKVSPPPWDYNRDMYLGGMKKAFGAKDYEKVLERGKKLEALGGALPDEAHHFLGVAYFHLGRAGEAGVALERYVERAGKEGVYYQGSLLLLLAVKDKDDAAFEEAKKKGTLAGYEAYLSSWPGGGHRVEAEGFRASARERDRQAREALAREEAARKEREAKDDAAYEAARGANTVSGYEGYLSQYPGGRHAGEAKGRLRELEMAEHEREERLLGLGLEDRVLVQLGLESLGKGVGRVDGAFGRRTRAGLRSWQREKGLDETGYLTREQADALMAMGREAMAAAEAERRRAEERRVKRVFRDCEGCPEMVVVPAGSYMMGSPSSEAGRYDREGPVHRVVIGERFAVGVKEVTRGEYGRFMRATGHSVGDSCWTLGGDGEWERREGWNWEDPGYGQTDGHPVVCVSWEDAKEYVGWLSRETGEEYRLLSEAEWEYVARGGSGMARHWGEGEGSQCDYANGADASTDFSWRTGCSDGYARTAPVGSYEANGYGLHDVLGNVYEWVEDCWNESYVGAPSDGSAWESGNCSRRVFRGGSWYSSPRFLRSANRNRFTTGYRSDIAGFRVLRTLTP